MDSRSMHVSRWVAGALLAGIAAAAPAQTPSSGFPEAATPMTPEALSAAVAGKVFAVQPSQGPAWRWQFDANGFFFINVAAMSDSGKWSVKDSMLCTEGKRFVNASCNEVRQAGSELYFKRDSGEVVKLVVR